jgi:tetratricopeptide (TPR) repeat protein
MHEMNRAGTLASRTAEPPTRAQSTSSMQRLAWILLLTCASVATAAPPADPVLDAVAAPPAESPRRAPSATPERDAAVTPDGNKRRDVHDWIAWKREKQIASLPDEARLFYRRGLLADRAGQHAEALENVRGAIELDPSFVQPHLTLAGWMFLSDPAQTLVHCAAVVERLRHDWNLQLDFAANAVALGFEALFAGLLLTGLIILVLRGGELTHGFEEQLGTQVSRLSARLWVMVLVVVPFLAGVGLTLPVLLLLGFLWASLRPRERALFVLLAAAAVLAPLASGTLSRFALALRTEGRPFYEVPTLEHARWEPERQARLEEIASRDPENGWAQFALGWYSRRDGRYAEAERAFEATLEAWPEHSAVLTDLGNVVAMRGHSDRALELYRRATQADPLNAAAHFNASQLLTRRFDYAAAQAELRLASAIDFELVKRYQTGSGANGVLPLADVWPGPRTFWKTLAREPVAGTIPLPLALRGWRESSGWSFSAAAALVITAGLLAGRWQHRRLPIRYCGNCGVVVCRRCAKRKREVAMCEACDRIRAGAETQEFSKVLLLQHQARRRAASRYVRAAFAALVPGFGLVSMRRVFGPVVLLMVAWLLGRCALGHPLPFSVSGNFALPGSEVPDALLWGGFALVYAWSLLAYIAVSNQERRREAEARAPVKSRVTQATRREPSVAA